MTVDLYTKIRAIPTFRSRESCFAMSRPCSRMPTLSLAARELAAAFVPIRKAGKLPKSNTLGSYAPESGVGALEMHADAVTDGAGSWSAMT